MDRFRAKSVVLAFAALSATSAGQHFSDVSTSVGVDFLHQNPPPSMMMGGGMAWFDMDADGDDDLFLSSSGGDHQLLRNDDGTFVDITANSGIPTAPQNMMGVAVGDYDDDGYPDLYCTCRGADVLLRNLGDGTFEDVAQQLGLGDPSWGTSASWADFDGDGDLDLYVGNYVEAPTFPYHTGQPNRLYVNEGTSDAPQFVDRAVELGVDLATIFETSVPGYPNWKIGEPTAACTLSVCTVDYDDDGDPDLAVGNDFGLFVVPNKLFRNDTTPGGPIVFTDVGKAVGFERPQYNMGINPCDYDRDGDWDFYLSDLGPNLLLRNDGGVFTDVTEEAGPVEGHANGGDLLITSWATAWADVDNDGWQDLYVVNGYIPAATELLNKLDSKNGLWRNVGDGTFDKVTGSGVANDGFGRGGGAADFDADGLMDLFVLNNGDFAAPTLDQTSRLFRNTGSLAAPGAGWVEVRLKGVLGHGEALGARVDAAVGDALLRRTVLADPVFLSSRSRMMHFGLGDADQIDVLLVRWPSGTVQELHDVASGQRLELEEPIVTIDSVTEPTFTRDGVEVGVRLAHGVDDWTSGKLSVELQRDGRRLAGGSFPVHLRDGELWIYVTLGVPGSLKPKLKNLDGLEVRVDVTADGSRGIDTRVVPAEF